MSKYTRQLFQTAKCQFHLHYIIRGYLFFDSFDFVETNMSLSLMSVQHLYADFQRSET